jgi:ribosomal protein L11 methylase PrmA
MTDAMNILEETGKREERAVFALEKIAEALTSLATVERERFDKEFPEKVKRVAEVIRRDEGKTEQFSDRPTDQWMRETEDALAPSRFANRFKKAHPDGEAPRQKRRSITPVPQGDINNF